jgi:hypothetical protein
LDFQAFLGRFPALDEGLNPFFQQFCSPPWTLPGTLLSSSHQVRGLAAGNRIPSMMFYRNP